MFTPNSTTNTPSLLKKIALQLAPFYYETRQYPHYSNRLTQVLFTAFLQTYASFKHHILIDDEIKKDKNSKRIEKSTSDIAHNLIWKYSSCKSEAIKMLFFGLPVLSAKFLNDHEISATSYEIPKRENAIFLWRDFLGWPSDDMVEAKKVTLFNKFKFDLSQRTIKNLYRAKSILTLQPIRRVLFGVVLKSIFNILRLPLTYLPCVIKVALENSIAYLIEPERNFALKIMGGILVPFYYLTSAIHLMTRAVLFPLKSIEHAYHCGNYIGGKPLGIFFGFISAAISFAAVAFMPYTISQNITTIIVLLNKFIAPKAMLVLNNIVIWAKAKVTAASLVTAGVYSLTGLVLTLILAGPYYLLKKAIKIDPAPPSSAGQDPAPAPPSSAGQVPPAVLAALQSHGLPGEAHSAEPGTTPVTHGKSP